MCDLSEYAFEPGQIVQCKTRFDETYKGEVVTFDLSSKILILKCPSTSGNQSNHDLHFLCFDSVSDVQILEEPKVDCSNDKLPNIETKQIEAKQMANLAERYNLVQAVGNGVTYEGLQLYTMLCKTYDRQNITWNDKVKIVVLNSVVIEPPYKEANCQPMSTSTTKEEISYVKSNVQKFWAGQAKQQAPTKQKQGSNSPPSAVSVTTATSTSTSTSTTTTTTTTTTTSSSTIPPTATPVVAAPVTSKVGGA